MRVTVLTLVSSRMLYFIIWLLDTSVSEKSVTSHLKVNECSSFSATLIRYVATKLHGYAYLKAQSQV